MCSSDLGYDDVSLSGGQQRERYIRPVPVSISHRCHDIPMHVLPMSHYVVGDGNGSSSSVYYFSNLATGAGALYEIPCISSDSYIYSYPIACIRLSPHEPYNRKTLTLEPINLHILSSFVSPTPLLYPQTSRSQKSSSTMNRSKNNKHFIFPSIPDGAAVGNGDMNEKGPSFDSHSHLQLTKEENDSDCISYPPYYIWEWYLISNPEMWKDEEGDGSSGENEKYKWISGNREQSFHCLSGQSLLSFMEKNYHKVRNHCRLLCHGRVYLNEEFIFPQSLVSELKLSSLICGTSNCLYFHVYIPSCFEEVHYNLQNLHEHHHFLPRIGRNNSGDVEDTNGTGTVNDDVIQIESLDYEDCRRVQDPRSNKNSIYPLTYSFMMNATHV